MAGESNLTNVTPPNYGGGGSAWADAASSFGWGASIAGSAMSAVNAYYAVEANKYTLKQQASSLEFGATMATLNAQKAESDAQAILASGHDQAANLTLQQGQQRASLIAGQGASGTELGGSGSNAEVRASQRLIQRIEALTMDSNSIRAANEARTRKVNAQNEALLGGVSAANVRGTAGSMSPGTAAATEVFGSAGQLAGQWAYSQRRSRRY